MHPAIAQGFGGGFRLVPVAHHHVRPANHDLAHDATGHFIVLRVDDAHFDADRRQAGRIHLAVGLVLGAVMLRRQQGGQRCQFGHAIALGEAGGGEHAAGAVEQCRGDRRCAIADALQRAEIELLQLRIGIARIQQHLDHGRRHEDFVDAFAGEDFQYLFRYEGRLHNMGAAAHEQRAHCGEVGQVEHRHHVQVIAGRIGAAAVQHTQRGERQIGVAEHHAFREAGGAAGVEDAQQGVATAACVLDWLVLGDQRFVAEHAFRRLVVAGVDHRADGLGLGGDLPAQVLEGIVDDQHGGLGVVEGIDDLGGAPANIHRVEHGIGPGHGLVVLDITLRVDRQHCHAIATGHAELLQRAGQASHAVAELGIGHAAALVADGRRVGTPLQMAVQTLGDVHQNLQSCCSRGATRLCRPSLVSLNRLMQLRTAQRPSGGSDGYSFGEQTDRLCLVCIILWPDAARSLAVRVTGVAGNRCRQPGGCAATAGAVQRPSSRPSRNT
ncbi:hypothetical protein D9M71_277190 [compost metagenome]